MRTVRRVNVLGQRVPTASRDAVRRMWVSLCTLCTSRWSWSSFACSSELPPVISRLASSSLVASMPSSRGGDLHHPAAFGALDGAVSVEQVPDQVGEFVPVCAVLGFLGARAVHQACGVQAGIAA